MCGNFISEYFIIVGGKTTIKLNKDPRKPICRYFDPFEVLNMS